MTDGGVTASNVHGDAKQQFDSGYRHVVVLVQGHLDDPVLEPVSEELELCLVTFLHLI